MLKTNAKLVVLTGQPGSGKTTLIKKLSQELSKNGYKINGFYTEEVRNESRTRIGFDVISINDHKRSILSREGSKPPKVGKYSVNVQEFEKFSFPLLTLNQDFLIIDEIGKMELLSRSFENILEKTIFPALENNKISMLVTIPAPNKSQIQIVERFRKQGHVFEITKENRNKIFSEIIEFLIK
ncbi:NTPCR family protein [Megaselia abdita]